MQIEDIFSILGIEPTKDEKEIKNAYRKQLVHTNPEDDPEGFKQLRTAYEEACAYARSKDEEQENPGEDTTPSGIWVSKAAELYGKLSTRCNEELWRELFDEDIFISLDSNEECRRKMLIFMMNHFNYPDCVWRLIEQNLQLRNDSTRLKEQFPADFVDFLIRRCLIKEVIDYTMFEGPDEADYDAYIRCYNAAWDSLNQKDYEKLKNLLAQADATGITHPYMELVRAAMYRDTGDAVKAQGMIEELHDKYPKDTTVLFQLAEFYHETKQPDRAMPCYQELKAMDNNHYMANYRLSYEYADRGDYEEAKECIRLVMRRGHDEEIQKLRIQVNHKLEQGYRTRWEQEKDINAAKELAWCLLQDDRFLAAAKLTEDMAPEVPEKMQAEFMGLCSRIYMAQGKFEKTLEAADKWQKLLACTTPPQQEAELAEYNRDVEIAHRIKMSTYHMMGRGFKKYYEKALEEYEFYQRQENIDPNALIDAARIYLETQEYQKCLYLAGILLNRYQIQYAYALMQEAYVKLWDAGNVIRTGMQVIQFYQEYERPYEEIARVYYELKQEDKLKEILELAGRNQVHSAYLDAYAYHGEEKKEDYPITKYLENFKNTYSKTLAETGNLKYYRDGYPVITKYLNLYPCNYILNTRGLFSMAAKEYDAALKDFHKILERDPADQFALNNIGCVLKYTGRFEEALPYFEKAWYYMYREGKEEPNAMPLGNMAHTYELLGEYGLAAKTYQRLVDDNSSQKESLISMKDLSANYARSGQTYQALRVLEMNMKASKEYLKLVYRVYLYAADWENADKMYETIRKHVNMYHAGSAALAKRQLECEHMLAWQLMRKGHCEEALEAMNRANAMCDKNQITISRKLHTDLLSNKLFMLAILRFSGQEPVYEVKAKKPSFLNRLSGFFQKDKQGKVSRTEPEEVYVYEEEGKACAEQLRSYLKGMCKEQLLEGSDWDAVNTDAFFYKERYVRYLEFMIALFTGSSKEIEEALTVLEDSSRCRLCNHGQCMRYTIARALYAAYQGDRKQAGEICGALLQRQPYNLYALCGLRIAHSPEKN